MFNPLPRAVKNHFSPRRSIIIYAKPQATGTELDELFQRDYRSETKS